MLRPTTGCGARPAPQEPLLASVKRRKLAWFGHVTRRNISKTILQGTLEGGRRHGRRRKCWVDNIKEWTSLPKPELLTKASCRMTGRGSLLNRPSCPPDVPIGQGTELNCTDDVGQRRQVHSSPGPALLQKMYGEYHCNINVIKGRYIDKFPDP